MWLIALAFAFWAFLLAFNVFRGFWQSGIAAGVTFVISAIAYSNDITALLGIIVVGFSLLTIFLTFKKG